MNLTQPVQSQPGDSFSTRFRCVFFLVLTIACQVVGDAASASTNKRFDAALAAFRAGKYDKARKAFEAARRAGLNSVALQYNLGVTYYHLGRYSSSAVMFRQLLRNRKWAALANYNLGLIALKQNEQKIAKQHFRQALKSGDKTLTVLATEMLSRLEQKIGQWQSRFRASIGHDGNVALMNGSEISGASGNADSFTELFAGMRYQMSGDSMDGFHLNATAYALKYQNLSGYDFHNLRLKGSYVRRGGRWHASVSGDSAYYYIEGIPSYRLLSVTMMARRKWHGAIVEFNSSSSRYDDIDTAYRYLAGWRQQLSAQAEWSKRNWRVGMIYGLELNDRLDYANGGEFFSYSPARYRIASYATLNLNSHWGLDIGAEYRRSDFPGIDTHDIGGLLESRPRRDDRVGCWAKLSRNLANHWKAVGKFSFTDNHSNFSDTSYTRNIVSLSLVGQH